MLFVILFLNPYQHSLACIYQIKPDKVTMQHKSKSRFHVIYNPDQKYDNEPATNG